MENPRRELAFVAPAPGFSVLLKRNCSISPAALAAFIANGRHAAVPLSSNGRAFEVGRHLPERARAEPAAELAKTMRN